ncbi:MAG: arginine--tRNA ligase, partial [Treponema sp.]|nr:arginine--tRNA ligase [Treponema sp.]
MFDIKKQWKELVTDALNSIFKEAGVDECIKPEQLIAEIPPNPEMGDIGFPMFSYAKILRKGPPQIAQMAAEKVKLILNKQDTKAKARAQGPYLNIKMDRVKAAVSVLNEIISNNSNQDDFSFGRPQTMTEKKVMVEFSSPNTNKPLHLGHLRNDVLGESISRIIKACGAQVRKVCIINDRGIHICKSMLAYKEHGQNRTPESENVKSDRFVGDWYVCFSKELKKEADELISSGVKKEEAEA